MDVDPEEMKGLKSVEPGAEKPPKNGESVKVPNVWDKVALSPVREDEGVESDNLVEDWKSAKDILQVMLSGPLIKKLGNIRNIIEKIKPVASHGKIVVEESFLAAGGRNFCILQLTKYEDVENFKSYPGKDMKVIEIEGKVYTQNDLW